ncbi:ependymin precursor [Esox lucius]|uniref:Ependymin n=1 Tax=Esox lucius TaxID=8010 RepID=EPD_ESOLU|nr:ependymin precursor [Esox lucius]P32188.1 RecName: Full=Ependymin; Short=EPD; Flags: Precursor [Esox lucius]AAA49253.1 ependymin [Esox lucius]
MQAFAVAALSIWLCLGATTLAESLAQSHGPQHCTSPNMTGVLTVMALNGGEIKATGHYHYDTTDKKLRFTESDMHLNKSEHLEDYLMLFEEGVFYDIDLKNQSCRKMSLQSHAHALELPAGAVHQVELFLGSDTVQEENIKVNIWMGSVPETKGQYSVSTTVGDCLPLSTFYSTDSITLLFSNSQVVTEVKEPEVFSLPSFCEGLELEDTHNDFFSIFNTV